MVALSNQPSNVSAENAPKAGYPSGVGKKFNIDGTVRDFPGNTIICHLDEGADLNSALMQLHSDLQASQLAPLYSLLPPPSWHMTVFEGVLDAMRGPEHWPSDLPNSVPLDECDRFFAEKLRTFDTQLDRPLTLDIVGWRPLVDGIGLHLVPAGSSEETVLRDLRNRLADLLRMRHTGHDDYAFHLSIAYLIRHPDRSQLNALSALLESSLRSFPKQVSFGAPEFCRFEDMFEFKRKFYLNSARSK